MVAPDFSEFQFAYGITSELEDRYSSSVIAPPVFPTQREEKNIGADVGLGINNGLLAPIFLQFKRSERMIQRNAGEWDNFHQEYHRFDLHSVEQHNNLLDISQSFGFSAYAAPGFHTRKEYVENHRRGRIGNNSFFISPASIGRVRHANHRVAYTLSPYRAVFLSEPEPVEPIGNLSDLLDEVRANDNLFLDYESLRRNFRELRHKLTEEADFEVENQFEAEEQRDWIRKQQQFFLEVTNTQLAFFKSERD